jgi:hypothetical protein
MASSIRVGNSAESPCSQARLLNPFPLPWGAMGIPKLKDELWILGLPQEELNSILHQVLQAQWGSVRLRNRPQAVIIL